MRVIATAGHVDHGKSTLVRALTGTDPDRWAEEHRRGLTIDLGYAWTTLPAPGGSDTTIAFVDVPGHQRFIANMLAGIGPAPGVLFVVAADEGWRRQSTEHLEAVRALGIEHGVVAVTRSDLADPAAAIASVREHLADTGLSDAPVIPVSAVTGQGMDELRAALGRLCDELPQPDVTGRVRLWIDRVFSVKGAGTVVTGTLESGTLRVGEQVRLHSSTEKDGSTAPVRGLQSLEEPHQQVPAVARVAVNLRGVATEDLARGDSLLVGDWHLTSTVDVGLDRDAELPEYLMAHLGTAAMQVRVRPLGPQVVRLSWEHPLPLQAGDRLVLRDPGRQQVLAGARLLDADPPALTRRGAGRRRGEALAGQAAFDARGEVERRGWMPAADLTRLGATTTELDALTASGQVRSAGRLLVSHAQWEQWRDALFAAVLAAVEADPLQARMPMAAAATAAGLPQRELVQALAPDAGLSLAEGHVSIPGRTASLGAAERGLVEVERRLAAKPFVAPEKQELDELGLGPRQLAAAVRLGRLVDLGDAIYLAPRGPALAMRELAALPQPFTTSQARQALGSTRRVVIPLLEELDRRGWTRRLDAGHRQVAR